MSSNEKMLEESIKTNHIKQEEECCVSFCLDVVARWGYWGCFTDIEIMPLLMYTVVALYNLLSELILLRFLGNPSLLYFERDRNNMLHESLQLNLLCLVTEETTT